METIACRHQQRLHEKLKALEEVLYDINHVSEWCDQKDHVRATKLAHMMHDSLTKRFEYCVDELSNYLAARVQKPGTMSRAKNMRDVVRLAVHAGVLTPQLGEQALVMLSIKNSISQLERADREPFVQDVSNYCNLMKTIVEKHDLQK